MFWLRDLLLRRIEKQKDRDRQKQTETDRDRQRQTEIDRETDSETDRERQTETDRQRETERDRERQRETDRDREKKRERQRWMIGRPIDNFTSELVESKGRMLSLSTDETLTLLWEYHIILIGRQAGRQIDRYSKLDSLTHPPTHR